MNQLYKYLLAGLLVGAMTLAAPLQQSHAQSCTGTGGHHLQLLILPSKWATLITSSRQRDLRK